MFLLNPIPFFLLSTPSPFLEGRVRDSGLSGHDDAALILPPPPPAYLVHTIDYFRSFVSDPYLFGQIAANHALSDIYAMNGAPVSALALAVLPYGPEDMVEDHLVHLLAGALLVLAREECALVGGHTSEGAETALGLAIHGTVHPSVALHKSLLTLDAAAAGDRELVLILTKGLYSPSHTPDQTSPDTPSHTHYQHNLTPTFSHTSPDQ